MDEHHWTRSGMRIFTAAHRPEEISQQLGLDNYQWDPPDSQAGTYRATSTGVASGVWSWRSTLSTSDTVGEHLSHMVSVLAERADAIRSLSAQALIEITIGYGLSDGQGGVTLAHELLQRLAAFPVGLWMDFYSSAPSKP